MPLWDKMRLVVMTAFLCIRASDMGGASSDSQTTCHLIFQMTSIYIPPFASHIPLPVMGPPQKMLDLHLPSNRHGSDRATFVEEDRLSIRLQMIVK